MHQISAAATGDLRQISTGTEHSGGCGTLDSYCNALISFDLVDSPGQRADNGFVDDIATFWSSQSDSRHSVNDLKTDFPANAVRLSRPVDD